MMHQHIIQCVLLWKRHFVNVPLGNNLCHRVQRGSSGGQHWYDTWSLSVEHSVKMCSRCKHTSNISCLNNVTKFHCEWLILASETLQWSDILLTVCQVLFHWQSLWPFTWQTLKTDSHNVPSIHDVKSNWWEILLTRIQLIFACLNKQVNSEPVWDQPRVNDDHVKLVFLICWPEAHMARLAQECNGVSLALDCGGD